MSEKMILWLRREREDTANLLYDLPPIFTSLNVLAVVLMNILAGKELFRTEWVALDCGFLLSWLPFLFMDMMCRRYGPKAALKVSLLTLMVNLVMCGLFYVVSMMPGHWAEYYSAADPDAVEGALNRTFGGTWYILMGSTLAMLMSSAVNSLVNSFMGRFTSGKGFFSFAVRSYVSTAAGQLTDNFVFALVVSHVLFGWTLTQVCLCSLCAAMFELTCEAVLSPLGYKICLLWDRVGIGERYLAYRRKSSGQGQGLPSDINDGL